jgi:sulfotransferase family protein
MHDLASATLRIDPAFASYAELMHAIFARSGLHADDPASGAPALSAAAMERYNKEIRRFVPQDRLLVWSPADGWEPLCEFVGAPVPPMPLPRANDARTFADRTIAMCMASLNNWHAQQSGIVRADGRDGRLHR